jgi:hypothetical protein
MEVSSLHDRPYSLTGPQKDALKQEVDSSIAYLIKRHNL